jgi:hypothetical protein
MANNGTWTLYLQSVVCTVRGETVHGTRKTAHAFLFFVSQKAGKPLVCLTLFTDRSF